MVQETIKRPANRHFAAYILATTPYFSLLTPILWSMATWTTYVESALLPKVSLLYSHMPIVIICTVLSTLLTSFTAIFPAVVIWDRPGMERVCRSLGVMLTIVAAVFLVAWIILLISLQPSDWSRFSDDEQKVFQGQTLVLLTSALFAVLSVATFSLPLSWARRYHSGTLLLVGSMNMIGYGLMMSVSLTAVDALFAGWSIATFGAAISLSRMFELIPYCRSTSGTLFRSFIWSAIWSSFVICLSFGYLSIAITSRSPIFSAFILGQCLMTIGFLINWMVDVVALKGADSLNQPLIAN